MEIFDLRHLRSRDLELLLEEERAVWHQELKWDYSSSAALIKRYVDACALPGYAAVDAGRAVGFSFYVYENYKGVVGDVFITESVESGTEFKLLAHVIETLQATPGIRRIEAQLMSLRHQPPCDFFVQRDIRSFRRKFMALSLEKAASLGPDTSLRLQLVPWDAHLTDEAAQLIAEAYDRHIDSEISDQYRSRAGAMRFLDNIIHYPGCGDFDPESSFLAFRRGGSEPCGMILCSVVSEGVAHITQICVHPELQGMGAGRALLHHVIPKLRARNFTSVTLTVTEANRRAVSLYEQMNFSTLKSFYAFVWDSPEGGESGVLGR